jgi:GTP-binding protein
MRHAPSADDMMMLNFLRECEIPFMIALTKCDKLNKTETEKRRAELEEELKDYADIKKIEFSAVKGTGVEDMKAAIVSAL